MSFLNWLLSGFYECNARRKVTIPVLVLIFTASHSTQVLGQPGRSYTPPPPSRSYIPPPPGPSPGQQAAQNSLRQLNERTQRQSMQESERQRTRNWNPPRGSNNSENTNAGSVIRPPEIVIDTVKEDGQGARIGLVAGDVLLSYDGRKVTDIDKLIQLRNREPLTGKQRPLVVNRAGRSITYHLPPGKLGITLVLMDK